MLNSEPIPSPLESSIVSATELEKATPVGLRLEYVDSLRGLAAIYVMFVHMWATIWTFEYGRQPTGSTLFWTSWLFYGHFAVTVFIVLSGFCLMLPVVRNKGMIRGGTAKFFKKRARRILPPYYFAMVLSIVMILTCIGAKTGTRWDSSLPLTWNGLLYHLFLVQNIPPSYEINHAFWSIATEWQIYFAFPLLVFLWRKWGSVKTTIAALILSYAWLWGMPKLGLHIMAPHYLGLFAIGMYFAAVVESKEEQWHRLRLSTPWAAIAVGGCIAVVVLCHRFTFSHSHMDQVDLIIGFITGAVLVMAVAEKSRLRSILSWNPMVRLGEYSYSLYLIHAPLIQTVWQYAVRPMHLSAVSSFIVLCAIGAPSIIGISYIFHLFCERPFMNIQSSKGIEKRDPVFEYANKV